jgi:hypothetical protein
MSSNKINLFHEKNKIYNILKIIIILLILFIIYRLFTNNINSAHSFIYKNNVNSSSKNLTNIVEGFAGISADYYGNVITLKNSKNIPTYTNHQCEFELDGIYRIDTLVFSTNATSPLIDKEFYIEYKDTNNNYKYLKSTTTTGSPPQFKFNNSLLEIKKITTENNLLVYTNTIRLSMKDTTILITVDTIKFNIYGGTNNLPLQTDYEYINSNLKSITNTLISVKDPGPANIPPPTMVEFKTSPITSNLKIYSLQLTLTKTASNNSNLTLEGNTTINIKYNNSLYPNDEFTINKTYKFREDDKISVTSLNTFIFLDEPIIANILKFEIQNTKNNKFTLTNVNINYIEPTPDDNNNFKKLINVKSNQETNDTTNICPNIDTLIETQTKTQQICDNLEYQDKIKSEKIRLERNSQYLLKLKNQQEQIDELNTVIQDLETKRDKRYNTADQVRVLQYQKQKEDASTIRDLANQRLESQDKNKLFMDVNLNYI